MEALVHDSPLKDRIEALFFLHDAASFESRLQTSILCARDYLYRHAGKHVTVTNTNVDLRENFSQCLLLLVTQDTTLVNISRSPRLYNFFVGAGQLTTADYPCDLDTTSIALSVLGPSDPKMLNEILDEMLQYRNEQGILQVYFDKTRERVDPVVCLNASALFFRYGRGSDVSQSVAYAYKVLVNKEYSNGTRYYYSAEAFLYFATRFVQESNSAEIRKKWIPILRAHLIELRTDTASSPDPLAVAMRINLAIELELLPYPKDIISLLNHQCKSGEWRSGWFYRYGKTGTLIENAGLTTALSLKALSALL